MFEEAEKKLYERAAYIESLDGTVKREYTTSPDDAKNVNTATVKRFFVLIAIALIMSIAFLIFGIVIHESIVIGVWSGLAVVLLFLTLFFWSLMRKSSKNMSAVHSEEVKIAFNAYGVVMRVCSDIRFAVYAYGWNDFENITENDKTLVGVRQGLAFIFPKRVMTEEEFEKFRRFSFASLGNKCLYKNFKQN